MQLSIFTPTHKPEHLDEAYRSLLVQQYENWEWVIAPNGKAVGNLPEKIVNDPHVRVVPYHFSPGEVPRIGALKRHTCDQCRGDVFIEMDHDDMLVPGTLPKIAKSVEGGADFVYSDAAVFVDRKDAVWPIGYGEQFGWETYELTVFGKPLLASRAFDASARSVCEIFYAPDHVRCWTREAYYLAGGHDKSQTVGDDHDLICRTYLGGSRFGHIGGCGYLYRTHPGNTVKSHNSEIQAQQARNRDKHLYNLVDEWCKRQGHGYIDLRITHPDVKLTEDGLSIKADTSSIGCIRCFDFLQLVPQTLVPQAMEEIYRVLVPGGWLCSRTPSTRGDAGYGFHFKSFWNEYNVQYFTNWALAKNLYKNWPKARFQAVRLFTQGHTKKDSENKVLYVYADLCAIKGQRQPGRVRI
jgi:glycosyltransferase involved in cell wall biosynthesis